MPRSPITWQIRPDEGYYTSPLPTLHAPPVRTFLPTGYEPLYPYPLVVFFHGNGSSDEQILRLAPHLSRRNYLCISLRGPLSSGFSGEGPPGYCWGNDGEHDAFVEEYLLRAVEQTRRSYHVHSERIYLIGLCEGASAAYRLGLKMPDKVAGVVSLNGVMPRPSEGEPLFRFPEVRQLKVLIGHGINNEDVPLADARRDYRVLYSAGVDVALHTYSTCHKLHPHMLRDVNRWIMDRINSEIEPDDCGLDPGF